MEVYYCKVTFVTEKKKKYSCKRVLKSFRHNSAFSKVCKYFNLLDKLIATEQFN